MLFDTRRSRWIGTALLSLSFGSIGIIHTIILVFGQNPTIGYGNENIPQVMTCAGAILWGGILTTEQLTERLQQLALGIF